MLRIRLLVFCLLGLASVMPSAGQFFDQGFVNPAVRGDYDAWNEGTAANPITMPFGCLYEDNSDPILLAPGCYNFGPTVYDSSNRFSQRSNPNGFWVMSANNEIHNKMTITPWPYFSYRPTNSGPPNQSHLVYPPQPWNSMFEFTLLTGSLPGESLWRAHMIADHSPSASQNPQGPSGIPFLGIGADSRRGNGARVGQLNVWGGYGSTRSTVRIWDLAGGPGSAALMYNYAIAQWPRPDGQMVPRIVFVALYHYGLEHSTTTSPGLHRHWNWKIPESFFHPGADIAFIDVEDIQRHCPSHASVPLAQLNVDRQINLDWNVLFRCMSDKNLFDESMPTTPIDLLGVHWAVEVANQGSLIWASVHGMEMRRSYTSSITTAEPAVDGARAVTLADEAIAEPVIPDDWRDPVTTEQMREWFWDACRNDADCWRYNAHRESTKAGRAVEIEYDADRHVQGVARDLAVWPREPMPRVEPPR
ncbi:MAG: hypothetical protein AAGE94_16930 [Acidobacteriota bacterium]